MRDRRRAVAALALLIAVGVVVVIFLGVGSSAPPSKASASGSSSTTTVRRRDLVETDTESGTLSYANSHTVYDRLSGTITWLPSVGQVIKPGQALFRVAGKPIILMNGSTPAYRDLGTSDSDGQDIVALNRNLIALGFNPGGIVVDDAWQAATTDGVDALQASLGETETGTLKLGSVVYLPGSQIVSTVSAQLGSPAALRDAAPAPEFVSLTKTGTTPQSETTPQSGTTPQNGTTPGGTPKPKGHSQTATTLAALLALLRAETAQLKAAEAQLRAAQSNSKNPGSGSPNKNGGSPSSANKSSNHNGSNNHNSPGNASSGNGGGGSATAVLTTSSTRLVATVQLDPSKQSEAKVGERVTVEVPSGHTLNGRVSAVSSVAQASSSNGNTGNTGNTGNGNGNGNNTGNTGSGSSTTIPVTITLGGHPSGGGLDQASVSVNFAQAKANKVLSVPVTALLATQGGGYAVQEAASPHHLIPVTPGLFAAGYVQISGPGIYPRLDVTDSQG